MLDNKYLYSRIVVGYIRRKHSKSYVQSVVEMR